MSGTIEPGDNGWVMVSTAMVFLMTPALAFFYAGLVNVRNVLNTIWMSFICMGVVTMQWVLFGYSLAFGPGTKGIGGFRWAALRFSGHENEAAYLDPDYSPTYPLMSHAMFQCAFAVITPALMSGSFIGRIKMSAYCVFVFLWVTFCYCPLAHWVWSYNGWLRTLGGLDIDPDTGAKTYRGAVDFAGGSVIHLAAGSSALVAAIILGPRQDFKEKLRLRPSSPPFVALGTGILWFGWIGFNAGSAGAANATASYALANSCAAASSAMLTWVFLEAYNGKVSVTGSKIAPIAGLACVTPASGFIEPGWALLIGILAALATFGVCYLKPKMTWVDDTLDVFACHGVGGALGMLLTGLFAEKWVGGVNGAFYGNGVQFWYQLATCLTVVAFAPAVTVIILYLIKYTIGLRLQPANEKTGADPVLHGEDMFDFSDIWIPHTPAHQPHSHGGHSHSHGGNSQQQVAPHPPSLSLGIGMTSISKGPTGSEPDTVTIHSA